MNHDTVLRACEKTRLGMYYNHTPSYTIRVRQFRKFHDWLVRRDARLTARIAELEAALREIAKAEGAYSFDRLQHATNTIEHMQQVAQDALASLDE